MKFRFSFNSNSSSKLFYLKVMEPIIESESEDESKYANDVYAPPDPASQRVPERVVRGGAVFGKSVGSALKTKSAVVSANKTSAAKATSTGLMMSPVPLARRRVSASEVPLVPMETHEEENEEDIVDVCWIVTAHFLPNFALLIN